MTEHIDVRHRRATSRLILTLTLCLLATGAWADGVIDILPDGITTTTIASPGSYRLAGDVSVATNVTAITIAANDVTLDLNGHVLSGAGFGGTPSVGIDAGTSRGTRIHGGTLQDFAGAGSIAIDAGSSVSTWIYDVQIRICNGGIEVGTWGRVQNCHLTDQGGGGIDGYIRVLGSQAVVMDCNVQGIGSTSGIHVTGAGSGTSLITRNHVSGFNTGIKESGSFDNSTFIDNVSFGNSTAYSQDGGNFFFDNYATANPTYSGVASVTSQAASNERGDNLTP